MEVEVHNLLKEMNMTSFQRNVKPNDRVIVELNDNIYKEAIIISDVYAAPSGAPYVNLTVEGKSYAVPNWDIYPIGSKKITNTNYAYIEYAGYRGPYFNGRGSYKLVFQGKIIKRSLGCCSGRKEANKILLDEKLLKSYDIARVYSGGAIVYEDL